jgi:hypothetical protein
MSDNPLQRAAEVCLQTAAEPKRGHRPCQTNPKTGQPFKQTIAERRINRKAKQKYDKKKREEKEVIEAEIDANDFTSREVLSKEDAFDVFEERGLSPERVEVFYRLAVEASRETGLTANEFFFRHGVRRMQESIAAGRPILLEEIPDEDVAGMLDTRADLYATWDYSCSWRTGNPENESFDAYIATCLAVKNDFFTLSEVCGKDFYKEAYQSWVDLMPKLDARDLPRRYTQQQMRKFLGVSPIKQRLLSAARNSMKSSFMELWIVQLLLTVPDCRTLIVTETNPLATSRLEQVKLYFEVQPTGSTRLQQLFPHYCILQGEGKATEFRCPMSRLHLTIGVALSSMESGGFAGQRNDVCLFDDPLSENTVGTEAAIKKTITKYDAIRKLSEIGALGSVLVCTPWAVTDLGAELQKRNEEAEKDGNFEFLDYRIEPAFTVKKHAEAIAKEDLLALKESDVVLRFPRRLDWKFLRAEMQSGREDNFKGFRSQYLVSWADLAEDSLRCSFVEEELKARTKPLAFFEPIALIDTYMSVDTAWSISKFADMSCIVLTKVIKHDNKTVGLVTDVDMARYKIPELAAHIVEAIHHGNPTKVVIEKSGSWQSLADEIRKAAMIRGYLLPHIYWKPTNLGGTSAKAKVQRVKRLEVPIADRTLFFAQGHWNDAALLQLVNFDGVNMKRRNDFPDALALGWETFFPNANQDPVSDAAKKAEEDAEAASLRRQMYDKVFGSSSYQPPAAMPTEPDRNPSPFGIPGLRNNIAGPITPSKTMSFGDVMKKPAA